MQGRQLYFYHSITKIACTVFGSLFSNIYTVKGGEYVAVPINYAGVPKHLIVNTNEDERNMINRQLPAMSFGITSFTYDSAKKLGNGGTIKVCCSDPESGDSEFILGHATPWIIGIDLKIKAKNLDEGFQIIEQILPYFSPTLSVDIKDITDIYNNCKYSRSDITLTSLDPSNEYAGSFEDKREIEWGLQFTMTIPYWGFVSGYPGVVSGLGNGNQANDPSIESVGNSFCSTPAIAKSINNIFINYSTDVENQVSPGIPVDPSTEQFLPEAGAPGHVSTTRISGTTEENITEDHKDYPTS